MAVEDFGGKVLGAPIEFVYADHQNNTDRAAAIARDWFERQHVDAVMDVAGSSEAILVQAVGKNRDKIVSLSAPAALRLTNKSCTPTGIHYTYDTYSTGAHDRSGGGPRPAAQAGSSSPSTTASATIWKPTPPRW